MKTIIILQANIKQTSSTNIVNRFKCQPFGITKEAHSKVEVAKSKMFFGEFMNSFSLSNRVNAMENFETDLETIHKEYECCFRSIFKQTSFRQIVTQFYQVRYFFDSHWVEQPSQVDRVNELARNSP